MAFLAVFAVVAVAVLGVALAGGFMFHAWGLGEVSERQEQYFAGNGWSISVRVREESFSIDYEVRLRRSLGGLADVNLILIPWGAARVDHVVWTHPTRVRIIGARRVPGTPFLAEFGDIVIEYIM